MRVSVLVVVAALAAGCTHSPSAEATAGPKGDPGPTGPAGPAGPAGATGPAGGPAGATGPTGAMGPAGATGAMGPAGAMGATGPAGAMGAMGPAGPTGAAGAAGATGPVGPSGAKGDAGAKGDPGPQGVAGPQGPPGSLFGEQASVFAGFTSASTTGAPGSREAMHAKCAAEFSGAHLCHVAEYNLATPASPVPSAGAWIDNTGFQTGNSNTYIRTDTAAVNGGRYTDASDYVNCRNWTATVDGSYATQGTTMTPAGAANPPCTEAHVLACCLTPMREKFRGFTSASMNGAVGGRELMHRACGLEFAGSHMCHFAEYERATPATVPPATGAWLDNTGFQTGNSNTYIRTDTAAANGGRYTDASDYVNCRNWTATVDGSYATQGTTITPAGAANPGCAEGHVVACCQ